jgi:hypothetical protein
VKARPAQSAVGFTLEILASVPPPGWRVIASKSEAEIAGALAGFAGTGLARVARAAAVVFVPEAGFEDVLAPAFETLLLAPLVLPETAFLDTSNWFILTGGSLGLRPASLLL